MRNRVTIPLQLMPELSSHQQAHSLLLNVIADEKLAPLRSLRHTKLSGAVKV